MKEAIENIEPEQPNCEGCEFFKHTHSNEHCYRYFQETSLCKLRQEPVEQPLTSEFTKGCRDLRKKGVTDEQWEYATKLGAACEIIDRLESKEQPPVGGFTVDCTKKYIYHWNGCRWDEPCGKAFREACTRIDRSEASRKELLAACEELVGFCYPDGKWRGWDNMKGILEIMQPIRRLAEKERKL